MSFAKCCFVVLLALVCRSVVAVDTAIPAKVHRFVSDQGWSVNAYVIESPTGLLLIDGQLLNADARLLAALIKSLNKPLVAALVTHAHSDHFAGFSELRRQLGDFPIYSTSEVATGIGPFHQQFVKDYQAVYGDELEPTWIAPQPIESGKPMTLAGLTMLPVDAGAGEASAQLVLYFPEQQWLFTGDATMHRSYYYVGEGRSGEALDTFARLKAMFGQANILYAGHGDPARLSMLDQHITQVRYLRDTVSAALAQPHNLDENGHLTREARERVVDAILAHYPNLYDYGLDARTLMSWNVFGLEQELGGRAAQMGQ